MLVQASLLVGDFAFQALDISARQCHHLSLSFTVRQACIMSGQQWSSVTNIKIWLWRSIDEMLPSAGDHLTDSLEHLPPMISLLTYLSSQKNQF